MGARRDDHGSMRVGIERHAAFSVDMLKGVLGYDILRSSLGKKFPLMHDSRPIAEPERMIGIVTAYEDGDAF